MIAIDIFSITLLIIAITLLVISYKQHQSIQEPYTINDAVASKISSYTASVGVGIIIVALPILTVSIL